MDLALVLAVPWLAPLATLATAPHDDGRTRAWYLAGALAEVAAALWTAAASPALDTVGRVLLVLVAIVGALSVAASGPSVHGIDPGRYRSYLLWLSAFWWSLLLLALSRNLGLSWVAIELTTVTSAVLVAMSGRPTAVEAAWKYVILCSVGLLLALLAVLLLLALDHAAGAPFTVADLDLSSLAAHARGLPAGAVRLTLVLLTVGLGVKIGFAPMHTWLPDAHSEAPAPVSGLLSGVLLPLVLVTLWRVDAAMTPAVGVLLPRELMIGFGLVTVAVATPFLLVQTDLKRLLAYSTAEQMGLLAIALGVGTPLALDAAFVQLAVHALVKWGLFAVAGDLLETLGSKRLARATGLVEAYPRLGWPWLVGLMTLSGLPPLPMFLTEVTIVFALVAMNPYLGIALAACLAVAFVGIAHAIIQTALGKPPARAAGVRGHGFRTATVALVMALPLGLAGPLFAHALTLLTRGWS